MKTGINILQKLRGFLFLKILLLFTLAIFSIITFILAAQRFLFFFPMRHALHRNTVNFAGYIVKELGTPPDTIRARELAGKLKIKIRIKSPGLNWTSHKDMIDFPEAKLPAYDNKRKDVFIGPTRVGLCVEIHKDDTDYLFVILARKEGPWYAANLFVIAVLIFTTFLILCIYFVMSRLLKPVRVLREGVSQLSAGNIDYEMNTNRIDELGKLVDSFNTMTRRIREMIHARERLLLDVSHELRSPLTRVKVALEFLEDDNTKKQIRDDISEMETMVTELLETNRMNSRYGGLQLEDTNMQKMIMEICTEFRDRKPGIKIASFPENVSLKVDRKRIDILFRNILDNALRYSDPESYPVEISLREKEGEITIAVQDFGTGIPEQDLPYIFEPFYRVDKSRSKKTGGYGLGMSLSKKIMEAHGGTIEIVSRLKVGTTVFLKFKT